MPVLLARRETRSHRRSGSPRSVLPSAARARSQRHDQRLAERVRVQAVRAPGSNVTAAATGRVPVRRLKQGIDEHATGEVLGGTLADGCDPFILTPCRFPSVRLRRIIAEPAMTICVTRIQALWIPMISRRAPQCRCRTMRIGDGCQQGRAHRQRGIADHGSSACQIQSPGPAVIRLTIRRRTTIARRRARRDRRSHATEGGRAKAMERS